MREIETHIKFLARLHFHRPVDAERLPIGTDTASGHIKPKAGVLQYFGAESVDNRFFEQSARSVIAHYHPIGMAIAEHSLGHAENHMSGLMRLCGRHRHPDGFLRHRHTLRGINQNYADLATHSAHIVAEISFAGKFKLQYDSAELGINQKVVAGIKAQLRKLIVVKRNFIFRGCDKHHSLYYNWRFNFHIIQFLSGNED